MTEHFYFTTRAERVAAFRKSGIYPVLSSEYCAGRSVLSLLEELGESGAKIVQLREKHASAHALYDLAVAAKKITSRYGMLLLLDDRADVAAAAGADGVHLGQDDLPVPEARKLFPELLIGTSTHNLEEILPANDSGADYLNIGPIYPTRTKELQYPSVGVERMRELSTHAQLPFSVMGGIKLQHVPELAQAGACHIAMVTEITQAKHPGEIFAALQAQLEQNAV
ncbi:MAG: thiamine phosphate synthase [Victivallaceae bacterium]|nr:thiamine phosphate synthase [Victivallaceae bacterium]